MTVSQWKCYLLQQRMIYPSKYKERRALWESPRGEENAVLLGGKCVEEWIDSRVEVGETLQ